MRTATIKTYSELCRLGTFEERYRYLRLPGRIGETTFGFDRHVNQMFYRSSEWQLSKREAIVRDNGCDLGIDGYEIHGRLLVHHMNPIDLDEIVHGGRMLLDPEYLITTTQQTHNAIHYGDESQLPRVFVERRRGDTKLW